jgi:hypothetical protein
MRRPSGYFKSQNYLIALPSSYLLKGRHRFVRLANISLSVADIAFLEFPSQASYRKDPAHVGAPNKSAHRQPAHAMN